MSMGVGTSGPIIRAEATGRGFGETVLLLAFYGSWFKICQRHLTQLLDQRGKFPLGLGSPALSLCASRGAHHAGSCNCRRPSVANTATGSGGRGGLSQGCQTSFERPLLRLPWRPAA